uniref:FAD-binding PCMH-type domain-containing protein n=1 Tax=Leptobrachium leishanense TaxID=445787 RepID=A0A8C5PRI3_9ANUR
MCKILILLDPVYSLDIGVGEVGIFFGCSVFFAIKDAINSAREERGLSNDLTFNSPLVPEKVRMACADDLTNMVYIGDHPLLQILSGKLWEVQASPAAMNTQHKWKTHYGAAVLYTNKNVFIAHNSVDLMKSYKMPLKIVARVVIKVKKIFYSTACLLPICSLNNMAVTTTEGIGNSARLHPVQERIAKAHGSQCGFCTPGMVMSMYALLRNHPEPTMGQIMDALSGNICRCTGYRPILDGFKTFSKGTTKKKLVVQWFFAVCRHCKTLTNCAIFLQLALAGRQRMKVFQGERVTWYSPSTLQELLELRTKYPEAPLVMGNTNIGKFRDSFLKVVYYPSFPGITIGSAVTLAQLKTILSESVHKLPKHKTKTFQALIQQLRTLAGEQIRSMATLGGHIASKLAISDLNPVLAAAGAQLNLISKGSQRRLPLNKSFFDEAESSGISLNEVLLSVFIPYTEKEEFVSAFRQAQRERNAYAIVNAGMRVRFGEGTDMIQDMDIFYGGIAHGFNLLLCFPLSGRHWNEEMLQEACRLALEEISISPSAPGGMVEYKRTMTISFFFKFFLQVTLSGDATEYLSSIKDFDTEIPKTLQIFQEIDTKQPAQDPVGRPIVHLSGIKHATGEAVYVDDMPPVDQELFIAFATSTRAHAKILSIDETEARKVPGVVDIIRAKDVPGKNAVDGQAIIFLWLQVECVGQIICAVVADTSDHARRAAGKIKIAYEDIEPAIITIEVINETGLQLNTVSVLPSILKIPHLLSNVQYYHILCMPFRHKMMIIW